MDRKVSAHAPPVKGTAAGPQPDLVLQLDDEVPVWIAEGEYLAVFARARKRPLYKRQVVELVFELLEDGRGHPMAEGTKLVMFCNLTKDGRVRRGSKFAQAWTLVAGRRPGRERMTTAVFRGQLVRCVVRTVKADQAQRTRTDLDTYSIIDRLVACGPRVRP